MGYGDKLNEEFDIESTKQEVKEMKRRIQEAKETAENPDEILYGNIQRANDLLDRIEQEAGSSFSARLMEVAANLVNAITSAANSIVSNELSKETTDQKREYLDLKKLEYENKQAQKDGKEGEQQAISYNQNNVICISDREQLLELIKTGNLPLEDNNEKNLDSSPDNENNNTY
jgi:hypothetical protein